MKFLSKQNKQVLWEVILDEPTIKNITNEEKDILYQSFSNNILIFYENEKGNNSIDLISLNKKFLVQMIKMIRTNKNTECGVYSIFFIVHMLEDKITGTYLKNHILRDDYIEKFRKIYFNEEL